MNGLNYLPKRKRSCFVYGCFSTAANKPHLGFHKFPSRGKRNIVVTKKNGDKCIYDRRQLWIDALNIGREASVAIDGVDIYVCSLHFAREDFYYNQDITGRRYLKENANPRRNLPARTSSPLTTRFNVRSLNRLKYRGYFNIHNPDGRKLTAPRRFLGANKPKETTGQSYTKTVWVVRKPNPTKDQVEQDITIKNAEDNTSVDHSFSVVDDAKNENSREEAEDDEQCTFLGSENFQQSNPWFTSELIIKEEPMSDSEQVIYETSNNEDEDDNNYEPNKLVIQTEEEEVQEEESTELGEIQQELDELLPSQEEEEEFGQGEEEVGQGEEEVGQGEEDEEFESKKLQQNDSAEEETMEYDDSETPEESEQQEEEKYDVTVVHVDESSEDCNSQRAAYETKPCYICGSEDCKGHGCPKPRPDDNYFVCLICSEMFPSQKQLKIHSLSHQEMFEDDIQMDEERTKNLSCEFCGRVLSTKATLREHIMIHTGEKPHQCLLCGKSFRHKANLVVHVNGHAVVSTYKCKKCNKAFTKKMDFESHLKFHVDASGNPLVCKICNAVFKSQRTLYNHSQLHSRKGMVRAKRRSEGPRDPVHVCKTCGKVLSTKATLKEHMMIHSGEKPHVCTICGRTIRHKANFVVHIQTHGQGKSYECDMCDEAFMRKSDLTQHKQVLHSKSKLLRCPICSEVFKSPQKFNRHMEIHESVVYMNETEELAELTGFQPHLLEGFLETS